MAETHSSGPHTRHAHEERDVDVRLLGLFGLGLVVLLGGSLLLMGWLFDAFGVIPAGQGLQTAPLAENPPRPPQPRLQTSPTRDMQEMLAAASARLRSYGWIDRAAGIARIPVERAMELLAAQGLPVWPDIPGQTTNEHNTGAHGATTEDGR
jgi:hypothetical protein